VDVLEDQVERHLALAARPVANVQQSEKGDRTYFTAFEELVRSNI